jgi:PAS domain S-box-containing protein
VAVRPESRYDEELRWREQAALAALRDEDGFRALVQNSADILVTFDEHATFLYVSPATQRLLGIDPADAIGMNGFDFIHPDDRDDSATRFRAILEHPGPHGPSEFRVRRADGTFAVLEAVSNNLLNVPAVGAVVMNARDVTERTSLSRALRTLGLGNEVLVHATDETALLADTCENIVASSGYLLAWVGYVEHDRGHTVRPVASAGRTEYLNGLHFSWGNDELGRGPTGTAIRTQTVQVLKDTHRSKKFRWRAAADKHGLRTLCALPLVLGDDVIGVLSIYSGEPGTFGPDEVAVLRRLADDLAYGIGRLRDSDRLARNEALLRAAEHLAHVGHWEWDLHSGLFTFMADEIFTIYGITHSGFEGSLEAALAFVPPEDRRVVEQAINEARFNGTTEVEHRIVRPDGEVRFVRTRSEAIGNGGASSLRVVGTCQDITDQKAAEQEVEHSRQFLSAITNNMAEGMIASDSEGVVTFVNAAAARLLGWQAADLLGKPAHASYHFQRSDRSPYPAEECPLCNVWARNETLHIDHDTFIRRDGMLIPVAYSASPLQTDRIRGAVLVFDDITARAAEQLRVDRELEKLNWVGRIRDALDQDRFVLYAQPIVDLATNLVVQHELLLRMVNSEDEIIPPDRFLPTAEEFGLILEIDRWVVGETARLAAQGYPVEFNLSAKSVVDPNMLTTVRTALETHGARPEIVVCEITETALLRDTAAAEAFVHGLNEMGCKVALDDFGAGFGGFAYLKRLPVSFLKIDRQFVCDLTQEASSRHVVSAVVSLAKAFSMQTVAEGAEDDATLEVLKELGVDLAQGFVIARPGPVAEVFVPAS